MVFGAVNEAGYKGKEDDTRGYRGAQDQIVGYNKILDLVVLIVNTRLLGYISLEPWWRLFGSCNVRSRMPPNL